MARINTAPGGPLGFVDKRRTQTTTDTGITTPANLLSESALDTRLTAISSTSYSAARLLDMTRNDKIYAVRLNDESTGI
jgi:hypothetical protein